MRHVVAIKQVTFAYLKYCIVSWRQKTCHRHHKSVLHLILTTPSSVTQFIILTSITSPHTWSVLILEWDIHNKMYSDVLRSFPAKPPPTKIRLKIHTLFI